MMAVNVEQLTTDVIPEPEPSPGGGSQETKTWETIERAREAYSRWMRDRCRTSAEEFDD
jgi:hypothetical protein